MGITKRPTFNGEELSHNEFAEVFDITHNDDNDEDSSDSEVILHDPFVSIFHFGSDRSSTDSMIYNLYEDSIFENTEFYNMTNGWDKSIKKKPTGPGMGRRKTNRAQNEKFLLSLGDVEQYNPKDEIFFNENKYGFTKVMKILCTKPEVKESFIEGNEDLLLKKKNTNKSITTKSKHYKLKRNISPEIAFKNLTSSQKSLFKQKSLPLTIINELESKVVQYFSLTPNGIYSSSPLSNYHRILLHGIVRYYSLDAKSMNNRGHRSQKIVQVRNNLYEDFQPPKISLLKFVSSPILASIN